MTDKDKKDWSETKGFRDYADHVIKEVLPQMRQSAMFMTIAPMDGGHADIKQATEIGMAILLDKPLIVIVPPGRHMAEKLLRIADHVIRADLTTDEGRAQIADAIKAVTNQ